MLPESERPDQQEQSIPTDDANSWFWKPHTLTGKPHTLTGKPHTLIGKPHNLTPLQVNLTPHVHRLTSYLIPSQVNLTTYK